MGLLTVGWKGRLRVREGAVASCRLKEARVSGGGLRDFRRTSVMMLSIRCGGKPLREQMSRTV